MGTIRSFLSLAAIVSLSACAPTVWDRPGTTPAEFSLDVEQCGRVAEDTAHSRTHDRCMESKGYVASASGAPRGSRTRTDRPTQTATLIASADIQYYRGASAADLLRFDPKLTVNRGRFDNSYSLAGAAGKPSSAPAGVGLLADVGTDSAWRNWFYRYWWF